MHNSHFYTSPQSEVHTSKLEFVIAHYNSHTNIHLMDENNNTLKAAQPISVEAAKAIVQFIDKGEINRADVDFKGLIPQNVIRYKTEERFIIWQTPAMKRFLHFSETLSIENGVYPIPPLVWKLVGESLCVYALEKSIETIEDNLFQAPFLNVSGNGSVCMGSARISNNLDCYEDIIEETEKAFFNSRFTHTNTNILTKRNIIDVLLEQQEKKLEIFDTSILIQKQGYETLETIL